MKTFENDFNIVKSHLENKECFAFNRFSDGELYMMQGKPVIMAEKVTIVGENIWPVNHTSDDYKEFIPDDPKSIELSCQLKSACSHNQERYYRGISCRCCVGEENHKSMMELVKPHDQYLTWANLFLNANYPRFVKEIIPLFKEYGIYLVCNEKARLEKFPGDLIKDWRVGRNAMINNQNLINEIDNYIGNNGIKNRLFLFSASALSKLAIYQLYKNHPNNTYIDIGTTMHPFLGLPLSRDYLRGYWLNQPGKFFESKCIW